MCVFMYITYIHVHVQVTFLTVLIQPFFMCTVLQPVNLVNVYFSVLWMLDGNFLSSTLYTCTCTCTCTCTWGNIYTLYIHIIIICIISYLKLIEHV